MSRAQPVEKSLDTQALFARYDVGWKTRNPDRSYRFTTVNQAGEVSRKDVYVNGAQMGDVFSRPGLGAMRTAGTKFVPQTANSNKESSELTQ